MHKIGILSDTHGLLRPEVKEALQSCEAILHGGDINKQSILDELEQIAPVYVVRGNNDKEWASGIPETLTETIFGLKIFMVHNKKYIPDNLMDVDLIIYGHSHKYEDKMVHGVRYINPGSCGPRRFNQDITLAILMIEEERKWTIDKILIPNIDRKQKEGAEIPTDIGLMIPSIVREINSGRSVKQIAKKYKISEELSEQINRMYLTHPGVDTDGILRRLGL